MENRSISLALISCLSVSILGIAATKRLISSGSVWSAGSGVSFLIRGPKPCASDQGLLLFDFGIPNPVHGWLAVDLGLDLLDYLQLF